MYTIFQTPGTFDLRSLDTFGLHAKPNSKNPIGYFGTGLKYALAVLMREGAQIELFCNDDHYEFFAKDASFRDVAYKQAFVERTNFKWSLERRQQQLPFTTQLGKNWELWQAFRELYANTLDEDGTVYHVDDWDESGIHNLAGYTNIVIKHLEFSRLVAKKDEIFLPQGIELIVDRTEGFVAPGKSKSIYYRGMRALDLPEGKETLFRYNLIDEQELTEDRVLKSSYSVRAAIESLVERSDDEAMIEAVLKAPEKTYEHELNFQHAFGCSDAFKNVLTRVRNHTGVNSSALRYYGTYISPPKAPKVSDEVWLLVQRTLDRAADKLDALPKLTRPAIREIYLETFQKEMER